VKNGQSIQQRFKRESYKKLCRRHVESRYCKNFLYWNLHIEKIDKKHKNTGSVAAKKQTKYRKRKFSDDELLEFIKNNPSAVLEDIANNFSVRHQSVGRRFKILGTTRKKRLFCMKNEMN
jgi:hypothetical protein